MLRGCSNMISCLRMVEGGLEKVGKSVRRREGILEKVISHFSPSVETERGTTGWQAAMRGKKKKSIWNCFLCLFDAFYNIEVVK